MEIGIIALIALLQLAFVVFVIVAALRVFSIERTVNQIRDDLDRLLQAADEPTNLGK